MSKYSQKIYFKYVENCGEISSIIDGPYSDPSLEAGYEVEVFDEDYEVFRNDVIAVLEKYCQVSKVDFDLISVGHRTGATRGLGVAIEEAAALDVPLLAAMLNKCLNSFEDDFCISLNIILDLMGDFKDISIGITKNPRVFVCAARKEWLLDLKIHCGRL